MDTRYYTPVSKFKAGRPFVMNGEQYNYDDPVDTTGIEPRRIRLMFEARLLEVDERPEGERKKAPLPPTPVGPYRIKNGGFGRWYVANSSGENVEGPFTAEDGGDAKKQAELALAKYQ